MLSSSDTTGRCCDSAVGEVERPFAGERIEKDPLEARPLTFREVPVGVPRVAIIFDDRPRPETTGFYCRRALAGIADVRHFRPDELRSLSAADFDLFINVDDGLRYRLPQTLRPCVWWAIDTHMDFEWYAAKASDFDRVFTAQRDGAEQLRAHGITSAQWLPLACDPEIHGKPETVPKRYDVAFVGNVFPGERADLLQLIGRRYPATYVGNRYFEEMRRTYAEAKIVFNRSVRNDVNMRVFEALASGSLLLTNDLDDNGQGDLFRDGVHLSTYQNADELLAKIAHYLDNEAEREHIARAGREAVLAEHTYAHRMKEILSAVSISTPRSGHSSDDVMGHAAWPPAAAVSTRASPPSGDVEPKTSEHAAMNAELVGVDLTLITPTGDRPEAFALCERWMAHQRFAGTIQWIVVDDGRQPTACKAGQLLLRREPVATDPPHTLAANLRTALPHVRGRRVLIIEDDDYYGPGYLATMTRWLEVADLVGEVGAKYYDLRFGWRQFHEHTHASLCRTGFTRAVLPALAALIGQDDPSVDQRLWAAWRGTTFRSRDPGGESRLCVGIKGMPGRPPPAVGRWPYAPDLDFVQLKQWVGEDDAKAYVPFAEAARKATDIRRTLMPSDAPGAAGREAEQGGAQPDARMPNDPWYYECSRPELVELVPASARRILDIGCGTGRVGQAIKARQSAHITGIELDGRAAAEAAGRLDRVFVGDVESLDLDIAEASLDCVICGDVLEHLVDPARLLRQLRRWLVADGRLIASIPNVRHHEVVSELLHGNWSYESAGILDATHRHFFTRNNLIDLFATSGYRIELKACSPFPELQQWQADGRPGTFAIGGLNVRDLAPDDAEGFLAYQYLVTAAPAAPNPHGLTSIVILTYNGIVLTRACIESLIRNTEPGFELVIVDNGSTDGTPDYIRSLALPNVTLIANAENRGFPAGVNQGVRASRGQQIVLLNNDTVVMPGWLAGLLHALDLDPSIGLVGPRTNWPKSPQVEAAIASPGEALAHAAQIAESHRGLVQDVDELLGFCLLVRRDVFAKIGYFDERFGIGQCEDIDFCRRARRGGFRNVIARSAFVYHVGHQTFLTIPNDARGLLTENMRKLIEKEARLATEHDHKSPSTAAQRLLRII
jgi:GT2 family glycosyltransferase/SAM-dependent methyltransferase